MAPKIGLEVFIDAPLLDKDKEPMFFGFNCNLHLSLQSLFFGSSPFSNRCRITLGRFQTLFLG